MNIRDPETGNPDARTHGRTGSTEADSHEDTKARRRRGFAIVLRDFVDLLPEGGSYVPLWPPLIPCFRASAFPCDELP
jgi:hypothetical protein